MKITALIDFFIHPSYFSKPNQLRKARLFVRACLLTSLFSNSYIWLSLLFGYDKGVYLMVFNVIGFLLLPFLAKTRLPLSWLGNVYVFIGAFAIIILTYFSGGVWSAVYPWIISIPVLALLVVNKLSGSVWGAISFIAMVWYAILAYQGVELPAEYNPELKTVWYITVLPGLLLIILFIAFVFESTQHNTLRDLEVKNELLESQKKTIADQSIELEKLIEEKDNIIRILAHDLKNPLSNIQGLAQLMKAEKEPKLQNKYSEMIMQSSSNARHLIGKVLEMDASEHKNINIAEEPINVNETLIEVVNETEESAKLKNIKIDIINNASKDTVLADKTYLSLIFENLLSNAIKFSEEEKQIQAVVSNDSNCVTVKIKDEGPGIAKEEEDQLFKKFTKLSARPTAGESSTGLGLSLVKRYVELMNGKVWHEHNQGAGATFAVELPLA